MQTKPLSVETETEDQVIDPTSLTKRQLELGEVKGEEADNKKHRGTREGKTSISVMLLPPNVFRLTNSPESECSFLKGDDAGQVIAELKYELHSEDHSQDNSSFKHFREQILQVSDTILGTVN